MIKISSEIEQALKQQKAIVGLESTIISHGMPYPENVKTALKCEEIIRENECVPATIAIINGEIIVGLNKAEIEYIANPRNEVIKVSRRDLPVVLKRGLNGALTVSATMMICDMVGIKFFATGGIGGVHKDAESTYDISADLREFTLSQVVVVSAGAKAILDLEKTLEYLETLGVLVIGYLTDEFPAFYTRESGLKLEYSVENAKELAEIIKTKYNLGLEGGILVANPIPKKYSYEKSEIDEAINNAIIEMNKLGIKGKKTTPFLLAKIAELTGEKSLYVNQQLVYNNCLVAAQVAKNYELIGGYDEKK
jgi:pseudouridylate synthase